MSEAVRVQRDGPVFTVLLDRPERRNAVDAATAAALARAFGEFDADGSAAVAVLYGEGGVFCAGRTSRRPERPMATASPPTEKGRWGRRGCVCPSR